MCCCCADKRTFTKCEIYCSVLCTTLYVVKMIVKIAKDSRAFLGVLLVVNLGFSQAFWLVANENQDIVFSTVDGSMINAFSFMMGKHFGN